MPSATQAKKNPSGSAVVTPISKLHNRCARTSADGRRCVALRSKDHPSLCSRHAQLEARNVQRAAALAARAARAANHQPPMRNFASEILGPVKEFQTAAGINHVLGRVLVLLAANRIPTRSAATIAYLCQLMLQSLSEVKHERLNVLDYKWDKKQLFELISSLPYLQPGLGASKCKTGKQ